MFGVIKKVFVVAMTFFNFKCQVFRMCFSEQSKV